MHAVTVKTHRYGVCLDLWPKHKPKRKHMSPMWPLTQCREEELAAMSARAESAEAKARTAQLEATQAQAALNEVSRVLSV